MIKKFKIFEKNYGTISVDLKKVISKSPYFDLILGDDVDKFTRKNYVYPDFSENVEFTRKWCIENCIKNEITKDYINVLYDVNKYNI